MPIANVLRLTLESIVIASVLSAFDGDLQLKAIAVCQLEWLVLDLSIPNPCVRQHESPWPDGLAQWIPSKLSGSNLDVVKMRSTIPSDFLAVNPRFRSYSCKSAYFSDCDRSFHFYVTGPGGMLERAKS
jgi:hypothetical protein